MPAAFAIVAHPDDIEFRIAGTLLMLKDAGWQIHYLALSSGSLGSLQYNVAQTRAIRRKEAQQAAKILGAHWHPSLVNDLEILYELRLLRGVAAVIREVEPSVILTHPPVDYMEDHTNTCRLVVSAAFCRGMPNLKTIPPRRAVEGDVTLYHCMPHGLCDPLRRPVIPEAFVNTAPVHARKCAALAAHRSQAAWLEASQGMNAFVRVMEADSLALGKMSRRFQHAEAWLRHLHLGFCAPDADPLRNALGKNYHLNPAALRLLKKGQ